VEYKTEFDEPILSDDFPVHYDYLYVADGEVVKSDVQGTVLDLKRSLIEQGISCVEVRRCDIVKRQEMIWMEE
jgi:hypothetical protein